MLSQILCLKFKLTNENSILPSGQNCRKSSLVNSALKIQCHIVKNTLVQIFAKQHPNNVVLTFTVNILLGIQGFNTTISAELETYFTFTLLSIQTLNMYNSEWRKGELFVSLLDRFFFFFLFFYLIRKKFSQFREFNAYPQNQISAKIRVLYSQLYI